jgi:hypothetical protein
MIFLIILSVWVIFVAGAIIAATANQRKRNATLSSDGHVVPYSQDLTCETQYGHNHSGISGDGSRRYVVHEEPEEGYVILNGVKRKLKDCKYL